MVVVKVSVIKKVNFAIIIIFIKEDKYFVIDGVDVIDFTIITDNMAIDLEFEEQNNMEH